MGNGESHPGLALCTMSSNRPRTLEYLLQGIGWSHTSQEFDRLECFARAHDTGPLLKEVEAAIASRRRALHVPEPSPDDLDAADAFEEMGTE
jgi:hypothetical protein